MNKFIAIFCAVVGAAYSDLDSNELVGSRLFPAVFILAVAYLFWFKGLVAIVAGAIAFHFSDFAGNAILESLLLPIFSLLCLGYVLWWAGAKGLLPFTGLATGVDSVDGGGCDGGGGGGDGC
jgi:hypothetical protein